MRELREQVTQRTEELTTAVEKLKTASITDPLTGLSNRRHVDSAAQPWIAELQRARIRNSPGGSPKVSCTLPRRPGSLQGDQR